MNTKFLFICFILFPFTTIAQKFSGGIIVGLNTSQVDGDKQYGYNKLGFKLGGFVETNISQSLSIKIETYYIGKGARKNTNPEVGDFSYFQSHFDYMEMPFILIYHTKKNIFIELGSYISYLFNSCIEDQYGVIDDTYYNLRTFDIGILFGLGYKFNDNWSAKTNFGYSLQSITNHPAQPAWYNNFISFSCIYKL